jgi:hypothetical protein
MKCVGPETKITDAPKLWLLAISNPFYLKNGFL